MPPHYLHQLLLNFNCNIQTYTIIAKQNVQHLYYKSDIVMGFSSLFVVSNHNECCST